MCCGMSAVTHCNVICKSVINLLLMCIHNFSMHMLVILGVVCHNVYSFVWKLSSLIQTGGVFCFLCLSVMHQLFYLLGVNFLHLVSLYSWKNASIICNDQCWAGQPVGWLVECPGRSKTDFFGHCKGDKYQPLSNGTIHWALSVHTTFSGLEHVKVTSVSVWTDNFDCKLYCVDHKYTTIFH